MLTAHGTIPDAVGAVQAGAADYLTKPFDGKELVRVIRSKLEAKQAKKSAPRRSAAGQKTAAPTPQGFDGLLGGKAPAMARFLELLERVAKSTATVLLFGESGTGKELAARILHEGSPRADGPFVIVDCGSTQPTLLESELFGHVKGSFTGANESREGLLSFAHDSTLFLDEIGELPLEVQASLLRVLETGTYRRVGEKEERTVTIRFLFATNRHLAEEVERGQFNEAFFHRINAFSIQIPSLKERKEDLPLLVDYFLTTLSPDGSGGYRLVDNAMACILRYGWPGNIRELRNVIERSIILAENGIITERCLPRELVESAESGDGAALSLASVERQHILKMLEFHGGNRQQTADTLGISRKTLYRKLTEYAID